MYQFKRFFTRGIFQSNSFKTGLLIYVMAPLISALGAFGYLSLSSIETMVEKQMQKDVELVARAIQLPLSHALEKNRMGSIQQALESVFAIGRVYSACIYDEKGIEVIRIGSAAPEPERDRLVELAAEGQRRGEYGHIANRQVFSYFVPLTSTGGQITGLLQITRKASDFRNNLQSIRIKGAIILGGLLVLLSVVVLYGHHRALGAHLERLTSTMARIAGGDRRHRFNYRGPREIVEIGKTFNRMLDSIHAAQHTILNQRRKQERLEKTLRHTEKLAAIGRLAAGTAHELGTPLSVIAGRAQRGLRDADLSDIQCQVLTAIRTEVHRMEYIIRQLLDFSRCNPLRCSAVNPARLAASAAASLADEMDTNQTRLDLTGPSDMPSIMLDPARVEQALINLLRNALQSTSAAQVCLSWEPTDSGVCYRVEDNGPGVAAPNRLKIFEPFFTTKPVGVGTGLGLPVVYAVAQTHGGLIEVHDSSMGGASFQLVLPSQTDRRPKEEADAITPT